MRNGIKLFRDAGTSRSSVSIHTHTDKISQQCTTTMDNMPEIQILDKERYFTQHIISLPDSLPYPALPPGYIRLRTKVLGLSASNLNVAKVAFLFNWWQAYPLPDSLPEPFSDPKTYGLTATWGYAEVLDSTVSFVSKGSYHYGYVPIGTLAFDVRVRQGEIPNHIIVTSDKRQHMPFYNRYITYAAPLKRDIDGRSESLAYDVLIRIMFETAHLLGHFVFAQNPGDTLAPGLDPLQWSAKKANLDDAVVIHLAPGSKAALCLAHILHEKTLGGKPKSIIGASSESSKQFVLSTGLYDRVVSTDDDVLEVVSHGDGVHDKIVLIDFGGRDGIAHKWAAELEPIYRNLVLLSVGGEISQVQSSAVLASVQNTPKDYHVRASLSHMRDRAVAMIGEEKYFTDLETKWKAFRETGIHSLSINWGTGMTDVKDKWKRLASGQVKPSEGLVVSL